MTHDIPLIIFAGGKSSRMGKDKALLPFGKYQSLAQFQYAKFTPYFKDVYLSSKTDKFDFDCKVIRDTQITYSPLVAILSIFETLNVEGVFILSVDAPFVNIKVIEKILDENKKELDVLVAQSPFGMQPLCGYYNKSIVPLVYKQLDKNNHKLRDLLALAHTGFVIFKEDAPFTNLNHPQEYTEAFKRSFN